jgi:hypothetical protein
MRPSSAPECHLNLSVPCTAEAAKKPPLSRFFEGLIKALLGFLKPKIWFETM